ncbi:MAG: hypothetical protein Q4E75_06965, partial [bacterium]|nr:hypothetical protein [bacterium]
MSKKNKLFELEKLENVKFKFSYIIHFIVIIIISVILVASYYMKYNFANESIEEILFYMKNGLGNSDTSVFITAIKSCYLNFLLTFILLIFIFYN